jgi:hypothetical protein
MMMTNNFVLYTRPMTDDVMKLKMAEQIGAALALATSPNLRPIDRKHAEWYLAGQLNVLADVFDFAIPAEFQAFAFEIFDACEVAAPTASFSPGRFNPHKKQSKAFNEAYAALFIRTWLNILAANKAQEQRDADYLDKELAVTEDDSEIIVVNPTVTTRTFSIADMQQRAQDIKTNIEAVMPAVRAISQSFDPDES